MRLRVAVVLGLIVAAPVTAALEGLSPIPSATPERVDRYHVDAAGCLSAEARDALGAWDQATDRPLRSGDTRIDVHRDDIDAAGTSIYHRDRFGRPYCSVTIGDDVTEPHVLEALLVHEIGHCLGLDHRPGTVMAPAGIVGHGIDPALAQAVDG